MLLLIRSLLQGAASVSDHWRRSALTSLSLAAAVSVYLISIGLNQTSSAALEAALTAPVNDTIVVSTRDASGASGSIDWGSVERFERRPNVIGVAALAKSSELHTVSVRATVDPLQSDLVELEVVAVSGQISTAYTTDVLGGRELGQADIKYQLPSVVVGHAAAQILDVHLTDGLSVLLIDEQRFVIVGILGPGLGSALDTSIFVPSGVDLRDPGILSPQTLVVRTKVGHASEVAAISAHLASPLRPETVSATVIDKSSVRGVEEINENAKAVLWALGVVLGIVALLGVWSAMLSNVHESRGEIGVKRAMGATKLNIIIEYLAAGFLISALGAAFGTAVGVGSVAIVSVWNGWLPVLSFPSIAAVVLLATGCGLCASAVPAYRAAAVDPGLVLSDS